MSAGLPALVLLALALAAMFAWFERTHPPARVIALVASLAALATVARVAFAPVPNVKPTTVIVLVAGYALGPAPGFAVGAIAALSSNVVFGQGPWTPWQMAALGIVGLVGAAFGAVSRPRAPAWGFAALGAACGLLYGTILDVWQWLAFTGEQSLAQLAAVMAASLPFNIAHALGNVLFALAFAPMLARSILRFRTRSEVTWLDDPQSEALARAG